MNNSNGYMIFGVLLVTFTVVLLSAPVLPYLYDSPVPKVMGALGLGSILVAIGLQSYRGTS